MDILTVEDWSKGAREVTAFDALQQSCGSPGEVERGGKQQFEESRYEPGLTLVDRGSDPRAWLAPASGTCAAHATSPDYLRHSPCPSTGSYQGEKTHALDNTLLPCETHQMQQTTGISSGLKLFNIHYKLK